MTNEDATRRRVKKELRGLSLEHEGDLTTLQRVLAHNGRFKTKARNDGTGRGKSAPRSGADYRVSDRSISEEIIHLLSSGASVKLTGEIDPRVIYKGNSSYLSKISSSSNLIDDEYLLYVPSWKNTGPFLKTLSLLAEASSYGSQARAFTLHLSDEVIGSALMSPDGLASAIQKNIFRNLKRASLRGGLKPPQFFFSVEADNTVRPHLHGIIILPSPLTKRQYKDLRTAMRQACGDWDHKAHGHQLVLKKLTDHPAGWSGYLNKQHLTTLNQLDMASNESYHPTLSAATSSLNRDAKLRYEKARQNNEELLPGRIGYSR